MGTDYPLSKQHRPAIPTLPLATTSNLDLIQYWHCILFSDVADTLPTEFHYVFMNYDDNFRMQ